MREIKFRAWDTIENVMVVPENIINPVQTEAPEGINCFVLMQFTGLHDKNGKEIYEGDIVDYGHDRYKPVEFIDGTFCICGITSMPTLMTLYAVVGNIYENPELLTTPTGGKTDNNDNT